jgi:ribosomal protein L15
MFIHRIKGIKRPMVKRVIFALLILTYEHGDKLIDQSKIRSTLSKEGFKNISSHKSEISGIVHKELSWLIHEIGLKINIKKEAEKEYALDKNAKKIIKILRKENLIEK